MPRFRLRFLLQEFDLVGPEVVLGRSPDCHITIEDPLISRRHARISIRAEEAVVADLGSRNGVKINGRPISEATTLSDGDRIRLGTQELLFSVVKGRERRARTTGYMCVCQACATPFPKGSLQCPHCGAPSEGEEDTVSGLLVESRRSWTFQLLSEVIERALQTDRVQEADRLMRRAAKEVDDRLGGGDQLESDQLSMIASFAVRLAGLQGETEWIAWALTLHRRQGTMLDEEVVECFEALQPEMLDQAKSVIRGFAEWFRATPPSAPAPSLARLHRVEKLVH